MKTITRPYSNAYAYTPGATYVYGPDRADFLAWSELREECGCGSCTASCFESCSALFGDLAEAIWTAAPDDAVLPL